MDIIERINDFLGAKDWSGRRLALESRIPKTVIYRILAKEISPTFEQIEKICAGLNITFEDFFNISLTLKADEVEVLKHYRKLNNDSKRAITTLIKQMK